MWGTSPRPPQHCPWTPPAAATPPAQPIKPFSAILEIFGLPDALCLDCEAALLLLWRSQCLHALHAQSLTTTLHACMHACCAACDDMFAIKAKPSAQVAFKAEPCQGKEVSCVLHCMHESDHACVQRSRVRTRRNSMRQGSVKKSQQPQRKPFAYRKGGG